MHTQTQTQTQPQPQPQPQTQPQTQPPRYVVHESSACMPASCWGRYVRVAVLEIEPSADRAKLAIDPRRRAVRRVVRVWDRLRCGSTERSAQRQALSLAQALCDRLNGCGAGAIWSYRRGRDWVTTDDRPIGPLTLVDRARGLRVYRDARGREWAVEIVTE